MDSRIKQMAPAPGAWSEGRQAFVTQGIPQAQVTGGNPGQFAEPILFYASMADAPMNT